MTEDKKKQIYESIMNLALKVVNEKFSSTHLNEGAWGYEPN